MNTEQKIFIDLLADHINNRESTIREVNCDWNILLDYARKHNVVGIIYSQCKNDIPLYLEKSFQKDVLGNVYYQTIRNIEVELIKKEFRDAGIPFFIIKGPAIADLYPIPQYRSMGDTDIVVHEVDREKCDTILNQNGFICKSKHVDQWRYYKNHLLYEVHDRLVYDEAVNEDCHVSFFNNCWQYVSNGQLDWDFHLLFLILHLRKHFMNSGVGFRQFMDLAIVVQKKEIEWTWVSTKLNELGLLPFAQRCFGFVRRWFQIETPIAIDIDNDFYEEATQKIFIDGVFGFCNTDNMDATIINEIRGRKLPGLKKTMMLLAKVFPPVDELEYVGYYNYLQKCPALLPIAWIQRWIRGIYTKEYNLNSMKKFFVSNKRVDQRNSFFKKWGL